MVTFCVLTLLATYLTLFLWIVVCVVERFEIEVSVWNVFRNEIPAWNYFGILIVTPVMSFLHVKTVAIFLRRTIV